MTFLTIQGVTEIFYSFRLILQPKTGKKIPKSSILEFWEKSLANNFPLSNAEDSTSGQLEERKHKRFTYVESTINKSPKVPRD